MSDWSRLTCQGWLVKIDKLLGKRTTVTGDDWSWVAGQKGQVKIDCQDCLIKSDMKFEQYDVWYNFIGGTIWQNNICNNRYNILKILIQVEKNIKSFLK